MADTGWTSPGTIANAARSGSDGDWTNESNGASSDNSYADAQDVGKEEYTDWLRASNFGFSLSNSTIDGIEVRIERYGQDGEFEDSSLRLHKSGSASGDDKASAVNWDASDPNSYVTYGGSSDDWSSGYSYTDINDSGFGVQLSAYNEDTGTRNDAYVDHIQIKVYYTAAGGDVYSGKGIGRGIGRGVIR